MLGKTTKEHWQAYWQTKDHQPEVTHPELLKNLQAIIAVKGKKILEIGVGMGGDSLFLAGQGAVVSVLDFSQEALARVRASAQEKGLVVRTILTDAQKIPVRDGFFDVVFHQGFLEHVEGPREYLLEQNRVLKKGGVLIVDVPQRFTTYTLKKHWQIFTDQWFAGWETEFSVGQLERLVGSCGFEVVRSYGWGYYGKLQQVRCLRLGAWYERFWRKIENSRLKLYLTFSIGVVAVKT
jgi:ubiquinone/menaquinone biosynthesis C-methylase UbiE